MANLQLCKIQKFPSTIGRASSILSREDDGFNENWHSAKRQRENVRRTLIASQFSALAGRSSVDGKLWSREVLPKALDVNYIPKVCCPPSTTGVLLLSCKSVDLTNSANCFRCRNPRTKRRIRQSCKFVRRIC